MAVGNLKNKVSSSDKDRMAKIKNPPAYEPGFDGSDSNGKGGATVEFSDIDFGGDSTGNGSNDGFSDIWDTLGSSDDTSTGKSGTEDKDGSNSSGMQLGVLNGTGAIGLNGTGIGLNGVGGSKPAVPSKTDIIIDSVADKALDSGKSLFTLIADAVKTFNQLNAADFARYFKNVIMVSLGFGVLAIILSIIGVASGLSALRFMSIPVRVLLSSLICFGAGIIGLPVCAMKVEKDGYVVHNKGVDKSTSFDLSSNIADNDNDELLEDIDGEEDISAMFGLGDNGDSESYDDVSIGGYSKKELDDLKSKDVDEGQIEVREDIDYDKVVSGVQSNVPLVTRHFLVETFKNFFPTSTPEFAKRTEIESDTEEFETIETICIKALAAAAKKELEEINCKLDSAVETFFTYEIRMTRYKGLNKTEDIAREITAYFRESADDTGVSTQVDLEGDFYKIVVFKGADGIITIGDAMQLKSVDDFLKNEKNELPFVAGVLANGKPLVLNAKSLESMIIAGQGRSGKSWYTLNFLVNLMAFNTPEDVQFVLVDPKRTSLFKKLSMFPHVAGLHDGSNLIQILSDIIDREGERRKKLLIDNQCDSIWELRKRLGIKIPILYLFIDEVMTIKNNLGDEGWAICVDKMKVIITQFPYIGIRLVIIPHRALAVIDKTLREMFKFKAVLKASNDLVIETLGVKRFDVVLDKVGDCALSCEGYQNGVYVKGPAVTTSDVDNGTLIFSMAQAFYKMGFEQANAKYLGCAYNRDESEIQKMLKGNTERVQLDL